MQKTIKVTDFWADYVTRKYQIKIVLADQYTGIKKKKYLKNITFILICWLSVYMRFVEYLDQPENKTDCKKNYNLFIKCIFT